MKHFEEHDKRNSRRQNLASKLTDKFSEMSGELQPKMQGLEREHKLEHVGNKEGVTFINDASSTSVNGLWFALEQIEEPIVLIMGSPSSNQNWDWIDLIAHKTRHVILLDECPIIEGLKQSSIAETIEEAIVVAYREAKKYEDSTVLFSLGTLHFPKFDDYEEWGQRFKNAYRML